MFHAIVTSDQHFVRSQLSVENDEVCAARGQRRCHSHFKPSQTIRAKTGTRLAPDQLRTMARDQVSTTSAAIKLLDGGAFVTLLSRLDRGGALQARKLANGAVQLYWRYSLGGETSREPIGVYDPSAPPKKLQPTPRGYGIAAALGKCRELADVHAGRADTGGLPEAPEYPVETVCGRSNWTGECRCWPIAAGQRSLRRATGPPKNLTPAGIVVAQMARNSSGRTRS